MGRVDVDEVLARVELTALLTELSGPPRGEGRPGARWSCPHRDHVDANPSATVRTGADGRERWKCWSGDHGGTAIDALLVSGRAASVRDALELLGADVRFDAPAPVRRAPPAPAAVEPSEDLLAYVEACERILWTRTGRPVREWLAGRGLDRADVLRANRVGADPGSQHLRRGRRLPLYGRAGPAATFPVLNEHGETRYVQTRPLEPRPGFPKYENPAAIHGSNPRVHMCPVPPHPRPGLVLVTEGIPDALVAASAGFNAAAVLGAWAASPEVAATITTHPGKIVILADNDPSGVGYTAAERLATELSVARVETTIIEPPAGFKDLSEWSQQSPTWASQIELLTVYGVPTLGSVGQAFEPAFVWDHC